MFGIRQEGSLGNVYFLFNTDCIERNNTFILILAQVQSDVTSHLLESHQGPLRQGAYSSKIITCTFLHTLYQTLYWS